ncbi:uncharacterized protein LODBEIA_P41100 [Lodderomyces beijingensis]|uniref:Lysophospholipase n=1 Tax=Lodderomyces beijingensis TaxID=1775926 RepID=A0ABP0ZSH1_9ASCO
MLCLFIILILELQLAFAGDDGYAPTKSACPGGKLTRAASEGLNPEENAYIQQRNAVAKQNLASYLKGANLRDFDVDSFLRSANPSIGLSFSGGGYRAQLTGAGAYAALDSRTAVGKGKGLGGILQSAQYISGLSGGSWLVGSLASNNMISIDELLQQNTLWQTEHSILDFYGGIHFIKNTEMWIDIDEQVHGKKDAGFDVSITDVWGRALSYQLLANSNNKGAGTKFSDVMKQDQFQNHKAPFPILVADGRAPDTDIINFNSTVLSITPFELGSEDPTLQTFVQLKYLGTELDDGTPSDPNSCVTGFDNAGFLMGTSSSLFNNIVLSIDKSSLPSFLKNFINNVLVTPFEKLNVDVAKYDPNPFYKSSSQDSTIAKSKTLYLVDGGEDGENVPLLPLVHRKVNTLFAFDNSNNDLTWPSGKSLIKTYERQFTPQGANFAFPYVPDEATFLNLNLTARPTFFGCDAKNLSSLTSNIYDVPLVVYVANRPFSYWSNTSTFKLEYSQSERQAMITNGFELATRLNGTVDPEWPACVGCAIIRREQERLGHAQNDQCKKCFERYCWNGKVYRGPSIGDNFDENGRTVDANVYNSRNVPGINDGGPSVKRRKI